MNPYDGSDLDEILTDLTDTGDEGIDLIVAGYRNIVDRARAGVLDRDRTQLLLAVLTASPDATDVIGAAGLVVAEPLDDTRPALHDLTDDARKDAIRYGQEAAFRLTDDYLRRPASEACAALDHTRGGARAVNDKEREELSDKVRKVNKRSDNPTR